jgi:hypothetical protein
MDLGGGANPVSCKWVKQQWPTKGFNFDESKVAREAILQVESLIHPHYQRLQGAPSANSIGY